MKKTAWILGTALTFAVSVQSFSTAFADGLEPEPFSPLRAFACGPGNVATGTVCATSKGYGSTLGPNPVQVQMTAQLTSGGYSTETGQTTANVQLQITQITDVNNIFNPYAALNITASARICSYMRGCAWRQVDTQQNITRTYGQRIFQNGAPFNISITGVGGAEEEEVLAEMDVWLPDGEVVVVKFQ